MYLQYFAQERTEPPSLRRLQKARERGQVFRSPELIAAVTLLAGYLALRWAGPGVLASLVGLAAQNWGRLVRPDLTVADLRELALLGVRTSTLAVGPVLAATLVAGLVANYAQVGFVFSLYPLAPDLSRLNPLAGAQRLFSRRALADLLKSLFKVAVVGFVAYRAIRGQLPRLPGFLDLPPGTLLGNTAALAGGVMMRVGLALLVLAAADYAYQRWEYLRSLRMTKQEVKEEVRETEGSPEVRSRIKRRQRELARRRMMADVKKADVVVTNPTHYAVALRYVAAEMDAPRVVAKGSGYVARRIRALAEEAHVPIVENPPLARTLYSAVEVGQAIPPDLYQAVAEVLAFVYRLRGMA